MRKLRDLFKLRLSFFTYKRSTLQTSAKEITLDIGEDRILLEARKKGYLLDAFVDYQIDGSRISAQFNTKTKVRFCLMNIKV